MCRSLQTRKQSDFWGIPFVLGFGFRANADSRRHPLVQQQMSDANDNSAAPTPAAARAAPAATSDAEEVNWYKLNRLLRTEARSLLAAIVQLLYVTHWRAFAGMLNKVYDGAVKATADADALDLCRRVCDSFTAEHPGVDGAQLDEDWKDRDHRRTRQAQLPLVGKAATSLLRGVQRGLMRTGRFDVTMLCDLLRFEALLPNAHSDVAIASDSGARFRAGAGVVAGCKALLKARAELSHNLDIAFSADAYRTQRDELKRVIDKLADSAEAFCRFEYKPQSDGINYRPIESSAALDTFAEKRREFDHAWQAVDQERFDLADVEIMLAALEHEKTLDIGFDTDVVSTWLRTHAPLVDNDSDIAADTDTRVDINNDNNNSNNHRNDNNNNSNDNNAADDDDDHDDDAEDLDVKWEKQKQKPPHSNN